MALWARPARSDHHPLSVYDWDRFDWPLMNMPNQLFDQHFGTQHLGLGARHPESGMSEVVNTKDKFQVSLNLSHFKPEEIKVKTVNHVLTVEGKHEEKEDQHGYISRHFVRKYKIPKDVDPTAITSSLGAGGALTIKAPKKAIEGGPREIPIQVEHKK